MIPDDEKDETRQDETEVLNDGHNDNVDEDKVDSLNDFGDENDDGNIDDKLDGFREDFYEKYGDLEEDQEPGKDMKPEPPPQPPLYRPSQPPIKLSFVGTHSFELRTNPGAVFGEDKSVFRSQDRKKIKELKSHFYHWHDYFSRGLDKGLTNTEYHYYHNEFSPWYFSRK